MLLGALFAGLFLATASQAVPTATRRDPEGVVIFKRDSVLTPRDLELAEMHGVNLTQMYKHSLHKRDDGDDITIWFDNGFPEVEGPQEHPLSKRQRARLWWSHHYSASGGGISDMCRQHDRKDWTSSNSPYTGGVRAIAEWARDNKGYFIWGDIGGGWVWRTVLIGGSNSGRNARYRGQVTDPGIATRAFVGTDDVKDDADWTHDRGRDFSSSTGGWRAASYG
ncbi:hypothetical protein CH63R_11223 [Colletotrichum higginsianum IMI 349063]|uniref:Secreted protein n=2 Tax=Colletotrichum higginsianum TaxID=80884 RepID=A0A1B7XXP7_COLHI|nr:hypothetical protein CH63R_11223 [Colletotrichum higginsianum IMI 349063]OBR04520.1 hypothetical protein CH63R_11223 [Colletotrichum higginsianum IMI 349063]TIC89619.1 hypothetical protein CH35J_012577 [Colletotrichum higginsianum]GJC99158.1 hypothetical protein ColKHC_07984 [Colletotrichum higginsianum]